MSNIKDLFGKNNIKVLPAKSLGNLVTGSGVESAGYIKSTDEEKLRFEPYVDYSIPKSFARYGSAEKYYTDTIDYIINRYPYDGSGKEKANWYLSSSYFDNYLFENEYPRTNGYITLGINYGGIGAGGTDGYEAPTVNEYIYFQGGPHTASAGMIGKPLSQTFTGSNYYKENVRESNLELNAPIGNSVEFWFKKDGYDSGNESEKQIFVDVWNSASLGDSYGRLRVECDFGTTPHQFSVAFQSGTANGFLDSDLGKIGQNINLTGSTWNHYALTFQNVGSNLEAKLYLNGDLNDTITTGSVADTITGSMLGWIGAMGTGINSPVVGALGYAKLSGSMDEFRFWKEARTETDIGRYWFTQVNAGTNTDLSNVNLGVYYKFNEGIVDTTAITTLDTNVLDYSGRITNGTWTGYSLSSRNTGSAMVISKAALSEFKDPIIYQSNPLVSTFRTTKQNIGYDYDVRNNAGIYSSIPEYITSDPQEIRGETLKNLTQIIGSYFDNVQLQIESLPKVKNVQYTTGSQKIAPFINRFLDGVGLFAPEIFADASALEYYASRDDFLDFSKKLSDTKNRIYENIYNNLVHVFKTKGTENSFRNLMRCYGVDEPLMKISLYGDETTQELRTNSRNTSVQKVFVDFNNVDRFDSSVYQQTSSTDINTRNYITASSDMQFIPKTMQAEAIFPKKFKQDSELYFSTPFLSCSLFGAHTPSSTDQTDLTWAIDDASNFQVYAVRTELEGDDVYFKLTSSAAGVIPLITSSVYTNVYDNNKWNLAVRVVPENYYIPGLTGSESGNGIVEFVGYNSLGDNVENNFYLTASISLEDASSFLSSSTRIYAGAQRTNFTGSATDFSDAKISSVRYWIDKLPNEAIEAHSKDASAFGPLEPHKSAYLVKNTTDFFRQIEAPQSKTLALSWTFDTVTGSGNSSTGSPTLSDANFFVPDLSSGSLATTSSYGWLGPVVNVLHSGKGDFFLPYDTNAVNREYVYSAKQLAPDILNSSNMVEVRTQDDDLFTRETRPQNYFYAIEKSQAAIISEEMMKWFATIKDFNFLIGNPVNRYRQEYKALGQLRELYFRSVGNTVDFERFVDFFKWVDDALSQMLMQLVPASANFAEKVRTMIESHVLERNKYWSKFPTLEMKFNDPEAGLRGVVEGTYPWSRGHAPIPLAQDDNCYWAQHRASASVFPSGDSEVDAQRNTYRLANDFRPNSAAPTLTDISSGTPTQYEGSTYAVRNFTKTYLFRATEMPELKGGSNTSRSKRVEYPHTELPFGVATKLAISGSEVEVPVDCNDIIDPLKKTKLDYKVTNNKNPLGYESGKGDIFSPFNLFSSSVESGYVSAFPSAFKNKYIANYHEDTYGDDGERPAQGPFTEKYVGGREYRHVPFTTPSGSRTEAWNLDFNGTVLDLTPRTADEPRSTILREPLAKRPVNIRNIKQTTGSTIIGNYSQPYEVVQTSGRKINNTFFVKNGGFIPVYSASAYVDGVIDYALPDYNTYNTTKTVFIERFNAPGGPDVSSRGVLDLYAEEYAIRNDLNQRNMIVRAPLDEWSTEHCGQFGIKSGSSVNELNYNTSASYFKVNRNPLSIPYIVDCGLDPDAELTCSYACKTQYDNWWVQHPIPRSDYQYAWITASAITSSGCEFFAHAGSPDCGRNNFSVPSGSSESMAAPAIQFVESTELWIGDPDAPLTHKITCSYNGVFTIFGTDYPALYLDQYVNQLTSSTNTISPGSVFVNTALSKDINYYFLNLNGPYQYPSWKQIRTGETPVARYQRNNNIITFTKQKSIYVGNQVAPENSGLTEDTLIQFTTPPVTFRYKPVGTTLLLSGSPNPLTLDSVYGNNMGGFPNPDINNFLGTSIKCEEQMFDRIKGLYHNAPSDSPVQEMVNVDYSEIVYPREIHAGLKEYRQRTEYAEVADGTDIYSGGKIIFVSASLSNGSNGIDRGPLYRRTFWRTDPVFRNRREGQFLLSTGSAFVPIITGTLPNSQGIYSGFATSINGWGTTPIVFVSSSGESQTYCLSGSDTLGLTLLDYPDTGELNSPNYQTIVGYYGGGRYSDPNTSDANTLSVNSVLYPTASCYYYHQQISTFLPMTSSLGLKWRVAELSGKNPWFDTYEDYIQDIRGTGKSFTIIPEFRISQHMDYYADGLFRKSNSQFLTLDGATITSSAISPTSSFNSDFFSEYSNTDFQKYFGKFDADNQVSEITLKCNGIKKLLPYHGFYPSHRTLQVASLFSQSVAPYIGGLSWASGTTTEDTTYPSGALAVQSLLQPYYAPGIIYNTIKAGIACDWSAYTGSSTTSPGSNLAGFLDQAPNYRIPFESILDPLADVGIPVSSSNGEGKLNLLYPSYQVINFEPSWASGSDPSGGEPRIPYVDLNNLQRARAISSTKYKQYHLAINNLLAEIPSFFLKDNELKTIVSKPAGDVSLVSGSTYYMNVFLEKDPNIVMIQDYWNGLRGSSEYLSPPTAITNPEPSPFPLTSDTTHKSWNGRYFGPPVQAGSGDVSATNVAWGIYTAKMGDPAYAPYTPPYFYGKSISTIAYTADASDEAGGFNYKKVFEKATITQTNPTMEGMFDLLETGAPNAPALSGAMGLSSSLNLFGLFSEKETRIDDAGNLIEVVDAPNSDRNKWVISPRMETPVLDFSTQPEQKGWGRGMWSGYGNILTSSNGITFGIEETFKGGSILQNTNTGSLLQKCFTHPEDKQVGEIATQKEISEAIVAIPFSVRGFSKDSIYPETITIMNKNFFRINQDVFDANRQHYLRSKNKIFSADPLLGDSVTKMLKMMDKYIIPPELDSLNFPEGSNKVDPFIMYMFEFNHTLSQQDLADIWQGVMPDISRIAQLSDSTVDNNIFSHPTGPNEFFGGKTIPEDIRWMVFKVKKRANFNYYKMTADTSDDGKFKFQFNVGGKELPYSYNWPYDFCSLVELAEIDVKEKFVAAGENTPENRQQLERAATQLLPTGGGGT